MACNSFYALWSHVTYFLPCRPRSKRPLRFSSPARAYPGRKDCVTLTLGIESTKRILDVTSWLESEACAYLYLQAFGQPRIRMCRTYLYMWQEE